MGDESKDVSFERTIKEWMVPIDSQLTKLRVPIPDRVDLAAQEFVEFCILDIKGDSKEDYLLRRWFRFVYRTVRRWYEDKYSAALRRPDLFFVGACEILGSLFRLRVPMHLRRDGEPGKAFWLVFPVDLQEEDDPASWLVNPPNLAALEPEARKHVLDEVATVARLLRLIRSDLLTAETPDEIAGELADNISSHLMASAERLIEPRQPAFGLACWEAHQAVEKALKLLGRQYRGTHKKMHELMLLFHDVAGLITGVDDSLLGQMPSQSRIIEMRAGEGASVDAEEAHHLYRLGLEITAQCVGAMKRNTVMRNTAFLIQKPPWM
jgi:hypothetical protein